MIVVTWGAVSDTGRVRARNEDSVLAQSPVFVIADGMGGYRGGATASRIAVDTLRQVLDQPALHATDIPEQLQAANAAIRRQATLEPASSAMGTTAVGLALLHEAGAEYWLAFNVGDSRVYRLHHGVLTQISVDHSYVQELVLAGFIEPDEARRHPERSIITRALGTSDGAEPDFWVFPAEPGERFLLCSDGLSGELDDATILELLDVPGDPQETAELLVRRANEAGGRDNISVIVVDVAGTSSLELDVPTADRPRATSSEPASDPASDPESDPAVDPVVGPAPEVT